MSKGSYLEIGSTELLGKEILTLVIDLTWEGLPDNFAEYYVAYKQLNYDFDSDCFRISASIKYKGNWVTLKVLPDNSLFKTDANNILSEVSSIRLQAENVTITIPDITENEQLDDDVKSSEGFFRIELIAPDYGFGSSVYPNMVTDVAIKNAKGHGTALPNPPYMPLIREIAVSFNE